MKWHFAKGLWLVWNSA